MSNQVIQLNNFNVIGRKLSLIDNLNLVVEESQWIEIKGNNNSGKSSLLDSCYGHIRECSGQLTVLDYSMIPIAKSDLSSLRKKIGYAKQIPNLLSQKTLRANLSMALIAADRIISQQLDEIITQIADRFNLKGLLLQEVKEFSLSQAHLASIARAVIHRPKLLLLDQSLDFLDAANRNRVIEILEEMRLNDRMTILSTSLYGWR